MKFKPIMKGGRNRCILFKPLCILKLTFVFLLVLIAQGWANISWSQETLLSLDMKNASLIDILEKIEEQTDYYFLFNYEQLRDVERIDVRLTNSSITETLDHVLLETGLKYSITNQQIIISKAGSFGESSVNRRVPQQSMIRVITGRVTDEDNSPLIGVYVKCGRTSVVVTDVDGFYKIVIPSEGQAKLSFSYIGKETKEIEVRDSDKVNVVLITSTVGVDEVVIIGGYGLVQKRAEMVGSAFQVNSEKIQNLPPVRVDNLLEGLVPGLSVELNSDSEANARPRIRTRVRGEGSLSAGSEPIWIVDGVRVYTGDNTNMISGLQSSITPLSFINPSDIENITVLKDANSVSIYGADGSNGVILVTTKKGSKSRQIFNASARLGVAVIDNNSKFKMLNGSQYLMLAKEAYRNRYGDTDPNMLFFPFQDSDNNHYSTTNTDWYKAYFGRGLMQEYGITMNGGNEKLSNYISAFFFRNEGTVKGNVQNRFSLRINTDIELHKRLSLSINTMFSYNVNTIFSPGRDYIEYLPIISPYNDDGTYRLYYEYYQDNNGTPTLVSKRFFNSLAERDENENKQRTLSNISSASMKYNIIAGLDLTGQFGMNYISSQESIYNAMSNWSGRDILDNGKEIGIAYRNSVNNFYWNGVIRLNYNNTFRKHTVGGLLAAEVQTKEYRYTNASGNTFANDNVREVSYAVNRSGSSSESINHIASFLGQVSYSYDQRYFVTLNGRRDGNSDFGEDVQWGNFGSIAASWNISDEQFFHSNVINVLKLKASYGNSGNSRLGSVQAKGIYTYGGSYNGEPIAIMSSIRNKTLSWETAYMTNIGFRIKLFDRLDVEAEWYNKTTDNLINKTAVSLTTGNTSIDANIAKMSNQGVEMNIESINFDNNCFFWSTSFNMSHNKNKILKLYVDRLGGTNKVWREGQDMNTWNLVRWAGVNPRNGEPLWYDSEGNITNVYDTNNPVAYKSSSPDFEGGMTNNFKYKDFNLGVIMTYVVGGYSYGTYSRAVASDGYYISTQNASVNDLDRWQKPGDVAEAPKPIWGVSTGSIRNSTRYLFDKTHLRLKNISLGYSLPKNILRKSGFSNINLSFIVDNVAIWTLYGKSGRNSYRQSMSGYPSEITYTLGVNMTF